MNDRRHVFIEMVLTSRTKMIEKFNNLRWKARGQEWGGRVYVNVISLLSDSHVETKYRNKMFVHVYRIWMYQILGVLGVMHKQNNERSLGYIIIFHHKLDYGRHLMWANWSFVLRFCSFQLIHSTTTMLLSAYCDAEVVCGMSVDWNHVTLIQFYACKEKYNFSSHLDWHNVWIMEHEIISAKNIIIHKSCSVTERSQFMLDQRPANQKKIDKNLNWLQFWWDVG